MKSLLIAVLAGVMTMAQPFAAVAQPEGPRGPGREPGMRQGPPTPTLAVTGRGEFAASPDTAVLSVGATHQAKEAQAAQDGVNRIVQAALEKIKAEGVAAEQIQTAGMALYPVYSDHQPRPMQGEPREPQIVGYRASNTLQVEVRDLTKVGNVIDAAIAAGANEMHGLNYILREDRDAKAAALERAVDRARSEAEVVAGALGMNLRGVERVEVGDIGFRPMPMPMARGMMMEAAMAPTPTEPGQVKVDATVTIVYRLSGEGRGGEPEAPPAE